MKTTIISTEELAEKLGTPGWVIVDCRFDLAQKDWGFEEYQKAHIPGAVYAHMNKDLAGPVTEQTGRHPLPDPQRMAERLGGWGIGSDTQVVVYDTSNGAYAARLWWLLRFLGHPAVAVLDGGFPIWLHEGRPVSSGIESNPPACFVGKPDWSMVAPVDEVERIRQDPAYRLIDARSAERFRGENETIDPVAGHIPGAINRFYGLNLSPEGVFLPADTIREQFAELLAGTPPENTVLYCGSGVTAAHLLLAMEFAGIHGAKLYPGSWSEWIRDGKRPISKD